MYLQADDQSPFYAKINNKMYSSSESGYMIIPRLGDSTFDINIGFAKNAFPEQRFPVSINKKDKGYQLKNLGEKGWALVNLQSMAIIQNTAQAKQTQTAISGTKKTDAFSELLANVVNDSAVLYTPVKASTASVESVKTPVVSKQAEKQASDSEAIAKTQPAPTMRQENNQPVERKDSVIATAVPATVVSVKDSSSSPPATSITAAPVDSGEKNKQNDPAANAKPSIEKPFITRIEEKKTSNTYEATYLELYTLTTDTIRIYIPLDDSAAGNLPQAPVKRPDTAVEQNIQKEDKITGAPVPVTDSPIATKKVLITNSDCKNFATDNDVDKFRIKLLDDKTIEDKFSSSKKYFRNKCYAVNQVKALSELFPSDETKFQFFELAYPYVSDTSNFYQLEEMIQNNLYKSRFKALINK